MLECITQLRPLIDLHLEEGCSPFDMMQEFKAIHQHQHYSFASKDSDIATV